MKNTRNLQDKPDTWNIIQKELPNLKQEIFEVLAGMSFLPDWVPDMVFILRN